MLKLSKIEKFLENRIKFLSKKEKAEKIVKIDSEVLLKLYYWNYCKTTISV